MSRLRNWCFTLHVQENKDYGSLINPTDTIRYAVWQLESCPTTSRLHIQGYIEFTNSVRLAHVKRLLGDGVHLEGRKGTRDQAAEYCKKTESRVAGPWELGDYGGNMQGKRTDLDLVAEAIQSGQRIADIVEEYPVQYIKFRRGIEALYGRRTYQRSLRFRHVTVMVYWGDAGTGKTRKAVEESAEDYYILGQGERLWWDGYEGQGTLILDDFYGWIKYGELLRILDGYQYRCDVKGSTTYAFWDKVIITSNKHPRDWYSHGLTPALERRLTNVMHFDANFN